MAALLIKKCGRLLLSLQPADWHPALFIYVFAETMGIALGATGVSAFIYEKMLAPALGDYPGSLVYALIYIIFCWSIVHILYKKGIYIKI